MDAYLPPGTTLRDIDGPRQFCEKCGLEGDELYQAGEQHLCRDCHDRWREDWWLDHLKRIKEMLTKMDAPSPPDSYDPESFEGRLLELEEELK